MLVLIFDLDNTIYPVASIADKLFQPLYQVLGKPEYGIDEETLIKAKREITKRPFQKVASDYHFPNPMVDEALALLRNMSYDGPIQCFKEYSEVMGIPARRFLVTTGFFKLQDSKVRLLDLAKDFEEICIIDPEVTDETKKDVFDRIRHKYDLRPEDIIVVGDDPESEIKAAKALGFKSFLLDPEGNCSSCATYTGRKLSDLKKILEL